MSLADLLVAFVAGDSPKLAQLVYLCRSCIGRTVFLLCLFLNYFSYDCRGYCIACVLGACRGGDGATGEVVCLATLATGS